MENVIELTEIRPEKEGMSERKGKSEEGMEREAER